MARSRSIPTQLLWDPDFNDLDDSARNVLIMLTLLADDEGRGQAHPAILARQCNKDAAGLEQALCQLEAVGFIQRYTVGRHCYFQHLRWQEWETLSKITASRFPPPPQLKERDEFLAAESDADHSPSVPDVSREAQDIPEFPRESSPEEEGEGKGREHEQKDEEEGTPTNVIPFPPARDGADECSDEKSVAQVAAILKLSITPALSRVVSEFGAVPGLSLLGEADAAREWIDDRGRNRKGQRMTPAFFRRWLKREKISMQEREHVQMQATGTTGQQVRRAVFSQTHHPPGLRNLMDLEAQYRAAQQQRKDEMREKECGNDRE